MLDIVKRGLHQDNLLLLIKQCDVDSRQDPITYFILEQIFKQIDNQYQDGQIPLELNQEINKLIPLIEAVLKAENDLQKKQSLNDLIVTFKKIS